MSLPPILEYESSNLYSTLFTETLYKLDYLNPKKELDLEGENQKEILIMATLPLKPQEEELLSKILKSIKLEKSDIFLLKVNSDFPYSFPRIIKILNPHKCIFLGGQSGIIQIPESWKKYNPMVIGNTQFILADSLSALESDPDKTLKNLLWVQLKNLFL